MRNLFNTSFIQDVGSAGLEVDVMMDGDEVSDANSQYSWVMESHESGFYFNMHTQLVNFASGPALVMETGMLFRRQRRFVHATAHGLRLGHQSLGRRGEERQMIIFKTDIAPPAAASTSAPATVPTPAPAATVVPGSANVDTIKRTRAPRITNGYECTYANCSKTFHLRCQLKKHEQTHQPENSVFQCLLCGKRFRYSKDLNRHSRGSKVHSPERLGTSFGSIDATTMVNAESRMSSTPSSVVGAAVRGESTYTSSSGRRPIDIPRRKRASFGASTMASPSPGSWNCSIASAGQAPTSVPPQTSMPFSSAALFSTSFQSLSTSTSFGEPVSGEPVVENFDPSTEPVVLDNDESVMSDFGSLTYRDFEQIFEVQDPNDPRNNWPFTG